MRIHPMHIAVITFVIGATMRACSPAYADTYTEQEVLIARLAVNEGSFRPADVAAIAYARARYTPDELRAAHPRALAVGRTDSRRWIEGLDASLARPDGWPEHLVPWDGRGRAGWSQTLATVHDVVSGRVVPCDARPQVWGGRRVDARHLARRLSQGYREVRCDGATANSFLAR